MPCAMRSIYGIRPLRFTIAIQTDFGTWQLHPDDRTLRHKSYPPYEIDLDLIRSAAQVLDWIFQIEEKCWVTDAELAGFIRAISYLFGRDFCGSGQDKPIDIKGRLRELGYG